jgi:SAM-dependent methyltransferase
MQPASLPTTETLRFVLEHIPSTPARVLEVGCGDGELALRLQSLGHQVIALDSSTEAVHQAKQVGVDARVAQWPQFEEEPFNAILFTRSLHHIHPLSKAVEQANALLKQSGLVLVEDFAYDEAAPFIVEWFYGILALLDACNKLSLKDESLCKELLLGGGDIEIWHRNHDHDLSSGSVMLAALRGAFEPVVETSAPYLYRYLCPLLEDDDDGYAIASRVLEMEKRLASIGGLNLVGRRFVGRKL